jgi:hypothetical protein
MNDDFSDLDEMSCEELGLQSYCFIVCDLLRTFHPDAELWRLHDSSSDWAHVFLKVKGTALDIKGFRDVKEMIQDLGGGDLSEQVADWTAASKFFYSPQFSDKAERDYVRKKLKSHIDANPKRFGITPSNTRED